MEKDEYTYNGNVTERRNFNTEGSFAEIIYKDDDGRIVKTESWRIDSNGNKTSPFTTTREYNYNENGDLFEETVYVNAKAAYYRYERKHISYYPERR